MLLKSHTLMLYKLRRLVKADKVLMNRQHSEIRIRWLWRMPSSGMWRCADVVWTDVSEEPVAPIFRVENSASEEPAWASGCSLQLADFSTLKMEAIRSSETSVHTRSTWRHIPENGVLHRNVIVSIFYLTKSIEMISASWLAILNEAEEFYLVEYNAV
jgi:hypothetical protein